MRFLAVVVALVVLAGWTPAEAQSLWQRAQAKPNPDGKTVSAPRGRSIYLRKKKERPPIAANDIVMINVMEEARASNDAKLESRREMQLELLLNQFVRFSGIDITPDTSPQPEMDVEANREVKGRGKTDRKESVHLRIAARVLEVLPNGNLVLEARKQKRINDEVTEITLTGEIRTADVNADYVVASDRIANMKLAYSGEGPVSANVVWTWVTYVVDAIWPF
ncbi:MAG: flagellar basal body L-ring protein FlgH [Planctomycetota bacterium]